MNLVQRGFGWVEFDFGFGLGVVGLGFDTGEIFESQVDVDGTRGAMETGKVEDQSC